MSTSDSKLLLLAITILTALVCFMFIIKTIESISENRKVEAFVYATNAIFCGVITVGLSLKIPVI